MPAQPSYTVILDWLEDELRGGGLSVGDKLPGERALAERFGISRTSVREATRMLDAMGLLRASAGSGPNAGTVLVSQPSAALAWALRMHIATRALPMADVVTTRVLLETDAARAAARAAQGADDAARAAALDDAEALVDRMDDEALPAEQFHRLDAEFHVLLASLARNVVVETVMSSLREATIGYVQETVALLDDWQDVRAGLQRDHRAVLAHVRARDGDAAADALRSHILGFYSLAVR